MNIVISHKTALLLYRQLRFDYPNFKLAYCDRKITLDTKYNKSILDKLFNQHSLKLPKTNIDLLYNDAANRYLISGFKLHFTKLHFPKDSFHKVNDILYIVGPELLFYNLAFDLNLKDLMLAGYELCGSYSFSVFEHNNFKSNVMPVTNPKRIIAYLQTLKKCNKNCDCIAKAIYVANQLKANSASPQESRLGIMLTSNRSFGGYGLKGFSLNQEVEISSDAKKICMQKSIKPDFSNKGTKVSIEYDSSAFHDNVAQNQTDKLRINALNHDGWKVFTFVNSHLHNFQAMDQLAIDILKANNQDIRFRSENFQRKKRDLYNYLYGGGLYRNDTQF